MNRFFNLGFLMESLDLFSRLDETQFETLAAAVSSASGYDHSLGRCNDLAIKLRGSFNASNIFRLLVSLEFLYDYLREWEKREPDAQKSFREFLEVTGATTKLGPDQTAGYQKLARLVAKNDALERVRKLRRLRSGLLETVVAFSSFVDIRPRFAEDRSSLEELVPIVILSLSTKSHDGSDHSPVFQLDLAGLAKLRATLDDIDKKLKALQEDTRIRERLNLEVPQQEEDEE
jgi:hypothetical protein